MTDIRTELNGWLKAASARYEDARCEVELIDGLIAEFERLTSGDTRAFPAVQPAPLRLMDPLNLVAASCKHCGQQIGRRAVTDAWCHIEDLSYYCCGGQRSAEPELDPTAYAIAPDVPAEQVNPLTATRAWCKNCKRPISRNALDGEWHHQDELLSFACYPDAVVSPEAEPDLSPPPVVAPVAQGVALADIQPCVTYLDRTGGTWSLFRDDGVMPILVNDEFLHMGAGVLISERGPLQVAPDPDVTRPDETPDGA